MIKRWLLVVALFALVGALTMAGAGGGTPTKTRVDHFLTLTRLSAHTVKDDGSNGESEYCIRVSIDGSPTAQRTETYESLQCVSSDWDETDLRTSRPWKVAKSLPLVGKQGYAGAAWTGTSRFECSPSAFWRMSIELGEADSASGIARVLEAAAEAVDQAELIGGVVVRGRLAIFGMPALKISPIVDEFFVDDVENLGRTDASWATGTGDSGPRTILRRQSSRHFSVRATKTVVTNPGACKSRRLSAQAVSDSGLAAHVTQQTRCGVDAAHIFCKNVEQAEESWSLLRQAAISIGAIRAEEGVGGGQKVQRVKRTLIKLVAELAEVAADTVLSEVPLDPTFWFQNRALLDDASSEFDDAAKLRRAAEARLAPSLLVQAIDSYEAAYTGLAPLIYPRFNP